MSPCENLDAFLDRQLESDAVAAFEAHLGDCIACQAAVEHWHAIESDVRHLALARWAAQPNPFAAEKLVRRATARPQQTLRPWWGGRLGLGVAAVAAAVMLVVGVQWARQGPSIAEPDAVRLALLDGRPGIDLGARATAGTVISSGGDRRLLLEVGRDQVALSRRGKLQVVEAIDGRSRLSLLAGSVALQVDKRAGDDRVQIEAAGTIVTVVGTRFMVSLRPAGGVDVNVAEGRVRVQAPGVDAVVIGADETAQVSRTGELLVATMSTHAVRGLARLLRPAGEPRAQRHDSGASAGKAKRRGGMSAGSAQRAEAQVEAKLDMWREWVIDGRYDDAEGALKEYVKVRPRDVEAWSLLADCHRKQGEAKASVKAYRVIIGLGDAAAANRARLKAATVLQEDLHDHAAAVRLLRAYLAQGSAIPSLEASAQQRLQRSLDALEATGR